MPFEVRRLTPADQSAAWVLGSLAFGYRDRTMPPGWTSDTPGRRTWGVFDSAGRLIAKAVDREHSHWFGGRLVPATGVAGVAVAADQRRAGLSRLVLTHLLAGARERGAVISTLFPTTPYPYRRSGWEEAGALVWMAVPTASLAGIRLPAGMALRPAIEADVPALRALYRAIARAGTGYLDRSGPIFDRPAAMGKPAAEQKLGPGEDPAAAQTPAPAPGDGAAQFLTDYDGVTVATGPDGAIEGYASWDREPGSDASGQVSVDDLVATSADATLALLAMLGGWASVAPTIMVKLPPADPARLLTAVASAPVKSRQPWMVRVVDAAAAVAARGWPPHLSGEVELEVVDEVCPWHAGRHRLILAGGEGRLEPGRGGGPLFSARALGLWYAGAATPSVLRRAGLLSGGSARDDEWLQAATAGPAPALLDYF